MKSLVSIWERARVRKSKEGRKGGAYRELHHEGADKKVFYHKMHSLHGNDGCADSVGPGCPLLTAIFPLLNTRV